METNFDNNIPIYLQIAEQIKKKIISNDFSAGEKLPSVREFALNLEVNPNTMQRALQKLEEERLIKTERTSGRFVTDDKGLIEAKRNEYVKESVDKFITEMNSAGFSSSEIIKQIKEAK